MHGFSHWDNLTGSPTYKVYKGSKYIIYNSINNCARSIEQPFEKLIYDSCTIADYEDEEMNEWETKMTVDELNYNANITKPQVQRSAFANYVYCFPGNITIRSKVYRCPHSVFKLPITTSFKVGEIHHVVNSVTLNVTKNFKIAVDDVHPGHFDEEQDVADEYKWLETTKHLKEQLKLLQQVDKTNFRVPKVGYGILIWGTISLLITLSITITYCYATKKLATLRTRSTNRQAVATETQAVSTALVADPSSGHQFEEEDGV